MTLRIERLLPAHLDGRHRPMAVVMDVLRATSTAAVLVGRGCTELALVATPEELERLPPRERGYLVVSELEETARFGARIDNSPVQARAVALEGRTPVLVTTNGTRALDAAARCAERVLVASLLNLRAVARCVLEAAPAEVTLLPAGKFARAESRTEDEACAEALQTLLSGRPLDTAEVLARIRGDERVMRRVANEEGFAADLELSLELDRYPTVLEFFAAEPGLGWIRPLA